MIGTKFGPDTNYLSVRKNQSQSKPLYHLPRHPRPPRRARPCWTKILNQLLGPFSFAWGLDTSQGLSSHQPTNHTPVPKSDKGYQEWTLANLVVGCRRPWMTRKLGSTVWTHKLGTDIETYGKGAHIDPRDDPCVHTFALGKSLLLAWG